MLTDELKVRLLTDAILLSITEGDANAVYEGVIDGTYEGVDETNLDEVTEFFRQTHDDLNIIAGEVHRLLDSEVESVVQKLV